MTFEPLVARRHDDNHPGVLFFHIHVSYFIVIARFKYFNFEVVPWENFFSAAERSRDIHVYRPNLELNFKS